MIRKDHEEIMSTAMRLMNDTEFNHHAAWGFHYDHLEGKEFNKRELWKAAYSEARRERNSEMERERLAAEIEYIDHLMY